MPYMSRIMAEPKGYRCSTLSGSLEKWRWSPAPPPLVLGCLRKIKKNWGNAASCAASVLPASTELRETNESKHSIDNLLNRKRESTLESSPAGLLCNISWDAGASTASLPLSLPLFLKNSIWSQKITKFFHPSERIEMDDVLQDLDLQKHRLLNLDAFYVPNFVTVSLNLPKKKTLAAWV